MNIGIEFDPIFTYYELRKLLGVPVDVLTPKARPDSFREQVLLEARSV